MIAIFLRGGKISGKKIKEKVRHIEKQAPREEVGRGRKREITKKLRTKKGVSW